MNTRIPPKRLYKYRAFNNLTLGMLVEDSVYFADPTTFNDPLDTKPTLDTDLDNSSLQTILTNLIEKRATAEMSAAAQIMKTSGPRTHDHIVKHSRQLAERLLADIRYNATNPPYEMDNSEKFLLGQYIQEELLRRYNKGVFSLGERANCPLMWSHYGDQHKGICLGYSVPSESIGEIYKIKYGGSRLVAASKIAAMLDGDEAAQAQVDEDVLLKKARPWAYEREWRLLGPQGTQDSPLELEEVIFGMRCPSAVVFGVVKALSNRNRPVRFYEIRGQHGRFLLDKRVADIDELMAALPRRSRDIQDFLEDLDDLDKPL